MSIKFQFSLSCLTAALFFNVPLIAADDAMTKLADKFCIKCHGKNEPQGDLRLDRLDAEFFRDVDRIERTIGVLAENAMPPEKSTQPSDELRQAAIKSLKERLRERKEPGKLKRLTREEYTNTINDLFNARFDLTELLPPDPPGDGFNKWGETQLMSPHQVESYLATARYIADRLILNEKPNQHSWEFDIANFRGTGRGDFQTETEHVLTTHYPWRSILYFVEIDSDKKPIFRIPQFGRYQIEAATTVRYSEKAETISLSTGDPRYPTSIKKLARAVLEPDEDSIEFDVTLKAGTHISFTYDSAATWNTGSKKDQYKGRQVRFTKVQITGPITPKWPTTATHRIFDGDKFRSLNKQNIRGFVTHVINMLVNRSLPENDVNAFEQLTSKRLKETASSNAAARTLLTGLLSSPHFIYKHETSELTDIEFAYRLSYFLWNSVPDSKLLKLAKSGKLRKKTALASEVERMLVDPRSDRFCNDFTRQWLATDKIDDIGPDDRVHNKKKVTFMKIRELAKEPRAFFREILHNDMSMINFIDSDFAMVNDETAEFYGFGNVKGREFQPVAIPQKSERGGLIGQAGLLKLTSTKHATSPILRGAWILKNVYGEKLNPPPGLAIEEPDIRSAKTVKDVLELHKKSETCNRCHSRIDPFGLALEHYDEMGLWREKYQHVEMQVGTKTLKRHNAPIDSTAYLPDGREVGSLSELKAVMMDDREKIIKGILMKMTSYALGREIGLRDEDMINEIYNRIGERDYSLRSAIHEIVAHQSFSIK